MYGAPLALLSFAAPALLAGALMIALPLIAHWMHRRIRTRTIFPSLRLLRDAAATREQFGTWRRWLLFLLRAAAIALIAAAFALPLWDRAPAADEASGNQSATLVLLDLSASMGLQIDGVPVFHHAAAAADDLIAAATRRGDRVQIVGVGSTPRTLLPSATLNGAALRSALREASPGPTRADWPGALALATRLLADEPGERHLAIISDFQEANWREVVERGAALPLARTGLSLIATPEHGSANLALHQPTLRPAQPAPGQPALLSVRAANHSDQPQTVEVALRIGELPIGQLSASLAPREERELVFEYAFDAIGLAYATFEIADDPFTTDNRSHLVCRPAQRPPLAIVSDRDPNQPGSAIYYLLRALSPRGDERDVFETRTLRPEEVSDHTLRGLRAVWLADAPQFDEAALSALRAHADRAGLAILLSTPEAYQGLRPLDQQEPDGWLPFRADIPQTAPEQSTFRLREDRDAAELLAAFGPAARDALSRVALQRRLASSATHPEARFALRYRDGEPALAWRDTAGGRIVMATFDPSRDTGALGVSAIWVALCHALMESMPQNDLPAGAATAGQHLVVTSPHAQPGGAEPILRSPTGERLLAATFLLEHRTLTASLPSADHIGIYPLYQGSQLLGAEAANLDPRESDLRRGNLEAIEQALRGEGSALVGSLPTSAAAGVLRDHAFPLWGWALLGVLALLALESVLLARWRS